VETDAVQLAVAVGEQLHEVGDVGEPGPPGVVAADLALVVEHRQLVDRQDTDLRHERPTGLHRRPTPPPERQRDRPVGDPGMEAHRDQHQSSRR
jgi:hypothetical protein